MRVTQGIEFVGRIEIVVAFVGGEFGIVAEPGVITAAMEAYVAGGRGGLRGWRKGISDDGLIDIAEAGVVLTQQIESGLRLPGRVAEFDDEGEVGENVLRAPKDGRTVSAEL